MSRAEMPPSTLLVMWAILHSGPTVKQRQTNVLVWKSVARVAYRKIKTNKRPRLEIRRARVLSCPVT